VNDELKVKWTQPSVLTSDNETERDHAWDSISYDNGIVAVPKEWAGEKGLPIGSTFPWDTSKAIYLVNGYHNLHCLVSSKFLSILKLLTTPEKHLSVIDGVPERTAAVYGGASYYPLLGRTRHRREV
jgi:hypothetical protein